MLPLCLRMHPGAPAIAAAGAAMPAIAAAEAAMPAIAAAEEAMPAAASTDLGNLPSGQLSLDLGNLPSGQLSLDLGNLPSGQLSLDLGNLPPGQLSLDLDNLPPGQLSLDLGNLPPGQLSLDLPMDFNAAPNVGNTVHAVQGATRGQLASITPCQHHASACKCATAPCQHCSFSKVCTCHIDTQWTGGLSAALVQYAKLMLMLLFPSLSVLWPRRH